jgi:SNF family Na+-dependent transporter
MCFCRRWWQHCSLKWTRPCPPTLFMSRFTYTGLTILSTFPWPWTPYHDTMSFVSTQVLMCLLALMRTHFISQIPESIQGTTHSCTVNFSRAWFWIVFMESPSKSQSTLCVWALEAQLDRFRVANVCGLLFPMSWRVLEHWTSKEFRTC